jgi:hypothetical protein
MNLHPKWTSQDLAALTALNAGMGGIRVLEVIEENMTEQAPEDFTGGNDDGGWAEATGKDATFPETPQNPHNHVYTWSPKLPDGSMLVVRANTPADLVGAVQALAPLAAQLKAAWTAVVGQPQQAPPAAQGGVNYNPQMPPPNQPFAGQPAWQQAGAQQAPQQQWAPPAPQGGAQVPQGWYKLTVPYPQKATFDAIVQQYNFRKGDPNNGGQVSWQKAVKSWYCSPEVAQAFAQFNPVSA